MGALLEKDERVHMGKLSREEGAGCISILAVV